MMNSRSFGLGSAVSVCLLVLAVSGCKKKENPTPLVVDAAATVTVDAAPKTVDIMQCTGCQLAGQPAWTFDGIYRDDKCTVPLAQSAPAACAPIPAIGPVSLTYTVGAGRRKAGETASVTITEQISPTAPRYHEVDRKCVKANESAVDVTPMNCAGQRVCRDGTGGLACTGCRTLENGCPDFEETRMYATINDPGLTGAKVTGGGGGGNLARLRQCCNALAAQAKSLGNSPEAGVIKSAAAQCNAWVAAAGPSGNAPELGALRSMLAGRKIPAVCSGF